jgi:hypothetical protein
VLDCVPHDPVRSLGRADVGGEGGDAGMVPDRCRQRVGRQPTARTSAPASADAIAADARAGAGDDHDPAGEVAPVQARAATDEGFLFVRSLMDTEYSVHGGM